MNAKDYLKYYLNLQNQTAMMKGPIVRHLDGIIRTIATACGYSIDHWKLTFDKLYIDNDFIHVSVNEIACHYPDTAQMKIYETYYDISRHLIPAKYLFMTLDEVKTAVENMITQARKPKLSKNKRRRNL